MGPNPSLSAITFVISHLQAGDSYTGTTFQKGSEWPTAKSPSQKESKRRKDRGIAQLLWEQIAECVPTSCTSMAAKSVIPRGRTYLEWREGKKRRRLLVGNDAQDAAARRQRKEVELNALNNGLPVLPENGNGQRSVAAAVSQFPKETELTKKQKALAAYTTALNHFTESCAKMDLHEIREGSA